MEGAWRRHARHGWQFHAERVRVRPPVGDQALLAYLGAVKHVGIRGAAWGLERHGPRGARRRRPRPRGAPARGAGDRPRRRSARRSRSWEDQGALRAVRLFLEEHGVPATVAARIYRHFGPGSIATLQEDPYALTELEGIGFATADALARALGTPPDSPGRLDAGIVHALHEAENERPLLPSRADCSPAPAGCSTPTRTTASTRWPPAAAWSSRGDRVAEAGLYAHRAPLGAARARAARR